MGVVFKLQCKLSAVVASVLETGADPENVEPGGANSKNYRTEPGGANLLFGLIYKGEQGGVRRVRPL